MYVGLSGTLIQGDLEMIDPLFSLHFTERAEQFLRLKNLIDAFKSNEQLYSNTLNRVCSNYLL